MQIFYDPIADVVIYRMDENKALFVQGVQARIEGDEAVYLCADCEKEHRHGAHEGTVVTHCRSRRDVYLWLTAARGQPLWLGEQGPDMSEAPVRRKRRSR